MIILEDLCADGYTVINKPPEDFDVSAKIVERLAKFHAANFFLIEDHVSKSYVCIVSRSWSFENILQKLECEYFDHNIYKDPVTAEMLFGKSLGGFVEAVSEWEGYEKYVPHLDAFKNNYLSKVLKTFKPNRSEFGFNVLNHADFHIRNLLFKKGSDGKIEDIKFVSVKIFFRMIFHRTFIVLRSIIKSATTPLQQ